MKKRNLITISVLSIILVIGIVIYYINKGPKKEWIVNNITIEAIECLDFGNAEIRDYGNAGIRKYKVRNIKTDEVFVLDTQRIISPNKEIKLRQILYSEDKDSYFESAIINYGTWSKDDEKEFRKEWKEYKKK